MIQYNGSDSSPIKRTYSPRWLYLGLILAITLIATGLRLWRLSEIPPGLEYDEAYNGLDAIWMLKSGTPYLFVASNHGREALFLYPAALFIRLLGATPFALRLTSALIGILAVPLLYRLTTELFRRDPRRYWLALVAAAGLSVSFWHISMSRMAFRSILIPSFFTLMAYLFWVGWQRYGTAPMSRPRTRYFYTYMVGAGVILGVSQYAYLSARLFPVILLLFVVGRWLVEKLEPSSPTKLSGGFFFWRGLLIIGGVSALVFAPLAVIFLNSTEAFAGRASQITFQIDWTVPGMVALVQHIAKAFSIFVGGSDPRIRHHLVGWPVFNWLALIAFWGGIVVAVRHWRRPEFLFLLLSLFVLWLPGPLSVDPIHNLRTSGILPAFYVLMAVGLLQLVSLGLGRVLSTLKQPQIGFLSLGLVLLIAGGVNTFNYFVRWANHPLVYQEYKGPRLELAHHAIVLTGSNDVILPYEFYAYPPVRYVLRDIFQEELGLPFSTPDQLDGRRPVIYLNRPEDRPSPFIVWLTRDETGRGKAYLTNPLHELDDMIMQPVLGSRGNVIAGSLTVDPGLLKHIVEAESIVPTPFTWGGHLRLAGYGLASQVIMAGDPGGLTLFWQRLEDADLNYSIFIQILNAQGEPISQLEERVVDDDIRYYENRDGYVYQQHLFWTGSEVSPGLYLLRVGLFDPRTGQRLPIATTGQTVGDQIILVPFYVSAAGVDPRLPQVSLNANLGDGVELLGYDLTLPLDSSPILKVKLYWQAINSINNDYTAFVHLLDQQNNIITQYDAQPLNGLYPTSRWQRGDIIMDEFVLPVSPDELSSNNKLVTGMYDPSTGIRLPAYDASGELLPDNLIELINLGQGD